MERRHENRAPSAFAIRRRDGRNSSDFVALDSFPDSAVVAFSFSFFLYLLAGPREAISCRERRFSSHAPGGTRRTIPPDQIPGLPLELKAEAGDFPETTSRAGVRRSTDRETSGRQHLACEDRDSAGQM